MTSEPDHEKAHETAEDWRVRTWAWRENEDRARNVAAAYLDTERTLANVCRTVGLIYCALWDANNHNQLAPADVRQAMVKSAVERGMNLCKRAVGTAEAVVLRMTEDPDTFRVHDDAEPARTERPLVLSWSCVYCEKSMHAEDGRMWCVNVECPGSAGNPRASRLPVAPPLNSEDERLVDEAMCRAELRTREDRERWARLFSDDENQTLYDCPHGRHRGYMCPHCMTSGQGEAPVDREAPDGERVGTDDGCSPLPHSSRLRASPGPVLPEGWEWRCTDHVTRAVEVEVHSDGWKQVCASVDVSPLTVGGERRYVAAECADPQAVLAVLHRAGLLPSLTDSDRRLREFVEWVASGPCSAPVRGSCLFPGLDPCLSCQSGSLLAALGQEDPT